MQPIELILIRHAPVISDGRVYGRRDLEADCTDKSAFEALCRTVPEPAQILASPARRCAQTARALWPGRRVVVHDDLWEQHLGAWEGLTPGELPDLGPLPRQELAAHRPPDGESFDDLCARVAPVLDELAGPGPIAMVVHAGTIRAALAWALACGPQALGFDIAPLSVTRLALLPTGDRVVRCVNLQAVPPA